MTRRRHRSRGFAIATALIFVAIVGVTVGLLSVGLAHDAKQTRAERIDAQLRQLLLAGTLSARNHLTENQPLPATWSVELPAELTNATVKVSVTKSDESHGSAQIEAALGEARSHQSAAFEKKSDRWIATSIE